MSKTVEFYFDFGSPTAYLAFYRLRQLADQYRATIEYRPVLLGGLFKAANNSSPVAVPAKGRYMMAHDLPRFSQRYGVELNMNPFFPINTLVLMRGSIAARQLGCFDHYADTVFRAIWRDGKNMGDSEVVEQVLTEAGLPTAELLPLTQDAAVKGALAEATEAAVGRGLFGVPTMFVDGDMFFGQDRLDFIEERLR
jgi:2-hydroxychromene-2-carboxylate isomerase